MQTHLVGPALPHIPWDRIRRPLVLQGQPRRPAQRDSLLQQHFQQCHRPLRRRPERDVPLRRASTDSRNSTSGGSPTTAPSIRVNRLFPTVLLLPQNRSPSEEHPNAAGKKLECHEHSIGRRLSTKIENRRPHHSERASHPAGRGDGIPPPGLETSKTGTTPSHTNFDGKPGALIFFAKPGMR